MYLGCEMVIRVDPHEKQGGEVGLDRASTCPVPTGVWGPLQTALLHSSHPRAQVSIRRRSCKPRLYTVLGTPSPNPNWFCLWCSSSGKATRGSAQSSCRAWKAGARD